MSVRRQRVMLVGGSRDGEYVYAVLPWCEIPILTPARPSVGAMEITAEIKFTVERYRKFTVYQHGGKSVIATTLDDLDALARYKQLKKENLDGRSNESRKSVQAT